MSIGSPALHAFFPGEPISTRIGIPGIPLLALGRLYDASLAKTVTEPMVSPLP
jgi:hypothetical protein